MRKNSIFVRINLPAVVDSLLTILGIGGRLYQKVVQLHMAYVQKTTRQTQVLPTQNTPPYTGKMPSMNLLRDYLFPLSTGPITTVTICIDK